MDVDIKLIVHRAIPCSNGPLSRRSSVIYASRSHSRRRNRPMTYPVCILIGIILVASVYFIVRSIVRKKKS